MSEEIDSIRKLAERLSEIRDAKSYYEEQIKTINQEIKDIEEGTLSSMLDNAGLSKMSFDDMDITKTLAYRPAYTKHSDKEAFKFLFDSNNDGALKKQLIIDLEAYPEAEFEISCKNIEYKIEYSIHWATLSSILKELVESGNLSTADIEKYSIYIQPQIKIKRKKEKQTHE